jgi:hypothetical protein
MTSKLIFKTLKKKIQIMFQICVSNQKVRRNETRLRS